MNGRLKERRNEERKIEEWENGKMGGWEIGGMEE